MASRSAVEAKRRKLANELARTEDGYVPTPPVLAEELTGWPYAMLNALPADARVLEPSAGDGALVRAILDANADVDVLAIEPDAQRYLEMVRVSSNRPVGVRRSTLEDYAATCPQARFDAVVMNPPFSLPGDPQTWVRHILLAFDLLRPGGRLVSIAPHGGDPTGDAGRRLLQLVAAHGGIDQVTVDRADMRAGFPAKVRVVWLVKPIPRPDGRPSWLLNPATGEPVRVREFDHGPTGAHLTPVQEYEDRWWGHRLRKARFVGTCATCGRLLWRHDDGREGAMGWEANSCLEAEEFGLAGPTVGFCLDCVSHRARRDRAVEMAQAFWRKPGDEPAAPATAVDVVVGPGGQLVLPL
jgi:SAM-dependent methyltransferase